MHEQPDTVQTTAARQSEHLARRRFFIMRAVNLTGVALVILGMLIVTGRILSGVPSIAGYAIIGAGMFEALVLPRMLARAWRTSA